MFKKTALIFVAILCFSVPGLAVMPVTAHHKPQPKFISNIAIVELKTNDKSLLYNPQKDSVIKEVFKKYGTPKVEPVFKLPAGVASWDEYGKKIKKKFPERAKRAKIQLKHSLDCFYKLHFKVSDKALAEIIEKLKQSPNVKSASYNHIIQLNTVPNDPYFSSSGSWGQSYQDQWGLYKIFADKVWKSGVIGSKKILIAVVDTGVDIDHPDLVDNIYVNAKEFFGKSGEDDDGNGYIDDINGWNFFDNDNDPTDYYYHGTHIAGIIAATTNNGIGIAGVTTAQILPVKVGIGTIDATCAVEGITYAANQGADVINCSWGGGSDTYFEAAVEYAYDKGAVIVVAAGNDTIDAMDISPANYDQVITVAASNSDDALTYFSNYGPKIDIAAPGDDILSLLASKSTTSSSAPPYTSYVVGTNYYRADGTSMAAPMVAGAVGLILAKDPAMTVEEVRQAIRFADDIDAVGWDTNTGYGRLNVFKALNKRYKGEALITDPDNHDLISEGNLTVSGYAGGTDYGKGKYKLSLYDVSSGTPVLVTSSTKVGVPTVSAGTLETLTLPALTPGSNFLLQLDVYNTMGRKIGQDIKELSAPYVLGTYEVSVEPYDVIINGNYVYVADFTEGLLTLDISVPSSPKLIDIYPSSSSYTGFLGLAMSGDYLFAAAGGNGMLVFDVSSPDKPLLVSTYRSSSTINYYDVCVVGDHAYLINSYDSSLQIVDISTPTSPSLEGSCTSLSSAHYVTANENYAFVSCASNGVYIVDVSSPSSPKLVGTYDTPKSAYGIALNGDNLYVADSTSLQILDVTSPASPALISSYSDYSPAQSIRNVAVSGGYAYLADIDQIAAVNLSFPAYPYLASTYPLAEDGYTNQANAICLDGTTAAVATRKEIVIVSLTAPDGPAVVSVATRELPGISTAYAIAGDCANNLIALAGYGGFQIIDIETPTSPTLEGACTIPAGYGVMMKDNFAYVADAGSGLCVIDITTPGSPSIIGTASGSYYYDVCVNGDYAYVAASSAGLYIFDISTPATPSRLSSCDTPGTAKDVIVNGNYAYVADGASGLETIDITTPEAPTLVDTDAISGTANALAISGNYLYVTAWSGGLQIYDISVPSNPEWISSYSCYYACGIFIDGSYLYLADRSDGLKIIDITNPYFPSLIASYDPSNIVYGVWVKDSYAYLAGSYGYASLLEVVYCYLP